MKKINFFIFPTPVIEIKNVETRFDRVFFQLVNRKTDFTTKTIQYLQLR